MEIVAVPVTIPPGCNVVVGQSHFIKTVEDLAEIVTTGVPNASFGLAFCEASGPCLIRSDGNDPALVEAAVDSAQRAGAGHTFWLLLRGAYPINLLGAIRQCPEVCAVFAATANPLEVLVVRSGAGAGIVGVVDGSGPKGVEDAAARETRRQFLRTIGYKR